jgi:hypothetical protein
MFVYAPLMHASKTSRRLEGLRLYLSRTSRCLENLIHISNIPRRLYYMKFMNQM